MESLVSAYKGKKVLITGHTGFKGAWLWGLLERLGARTMGYALTPEHNPSLFDIINERPDDSIIADIRDRDRFKATINNFEPDFVFHLAAQALVRRSYHIPTETFDVNVTGTANVLETIKGLDKKCTVIIITTDKVYENPELDIPFTEEDILGGHDPYSTSKACAELVTTSFRKSFYSPEKYDTHQKAIATARAGNVIGGGDWSEDRIIPDIIRALDKQQTIEVRNPHAVRPWQHVLEPLTGYLELGRQLAENPQKYSGAYNFGPTPGDHLTVGELVDIAIRIYGTGTWKDTSSPHQHHEAGLLKLDISKALRDLDWAPKLSAREAIHWTIEWYKKGPSEQRAFTLEQIEQFLNL